MPWWLLLLPNILQRAIWVPTRIALRFFLRLKINGLQNLAGLARGGTIFAVSHTAELDVFVLPGSFPFLSRFLPMFYLSRGREFYDESGWRQRFYGGSLFTIFGAHPVPTGLHDYERSLAAHLKILAAGKSICVFPEGGVSHDGTLQKGKGGVGYLAWKSGCPVVPVFISGIRKLTLDDFFLRRRRASIAFGKPVSSEELFAGAKGVPVVSGVRNDFTDAAQVVMEHIVALRTGSPPALYKREES